MIISRNDILIYEAEVGTAPKKQEAAHQHQFILHAALDVVQDLADRFFVMVCCSAYHIIEFFLKSAEIEGLKRKLSSKLAANSPGLQPDWQVFLIEEV
ncbi:hypothetical protein L1987_34466 [Smallanthus sonchifolius]|uniref:Uncharacterized protein n=2 Tax=Smallanthus sonchifolius TaxID=185202 RepID=A0ACB9HUM2_9ASTR|nr:hypothetical protein L1987_34461 [Smallanthus sonchifolius]KAI3799176.1 hypothetical protein L1987_34466 [Smallanthus sonchifolius]